MEEDVEQAATPRLCQRVAATGPRNRSTAGCLGIEAMQSFSKGVGLTNGQIPKPSILLSGYEPLRILPQSTSKVFIARTLNFGVFLNHLTFS